MLLLLKMMKARSSSRPPLHNCSRPTVDLQRVLENVLQHFREVDHWAIDMMKLTVSESSALLVSVTHHTHSTDRFRGADTNERVRYKLCTLVQRRLNGTAPQYLTAHCVPVSAIAARQHLARPPVICSHRCSTSPVQLRGTRCRNVCETPPTALLFLDVCSKQFFSLTINVYSTLKALAMMRYINLLLHYIALHYNATEVF